MQRHGERGAITPAMGAAVIMLAVVSLGGIALGRIAAARQDAQQAADATALAAADIVRERGFPFDANDRLAAEAVGRRNSKLPISFNWNVQQQPDAVAFTVTSSIDVAMPALAFTDSSKQVQANATGEIPQRRFDEAERRLPKLTLVLDYSGSMSLPFSGGSGQAIDALESSVRSLLNANLRIEYGAVFYSTNVFRTHGIGPNTPAAINSSMNSYGAGGSTNTAAGINRATNILTAAQNTGRYILLVSDGEPCCGGNAFGAGRQAAVNAWNNDVTIFTLEIRRSGSSSALDRFMTDVAGSPTSRRDRNYHFVATTAAALVTQFQNIVASIVCKAGPLSPAPTDLSSLRVFLSRSATNERAVPATNNLAADRFTEAYQYNPADQTIRLTERACDAVIDNGDEIVVRYDRPTLTD